ncbi:haloacid dehalogenase-like hydrolase [Flavobacterium sp. GN10]|uniref:phosphoserine phosphatase n=1 Tax=Flavobacterium tagetis TaxID=2801336 RepID=A0ABS1KE72_9FLAO|nr:MULTISPECIES: HAD family hydrolase [Flavobacterium]KAF2326698.1 haloacid dehalogenase-like hydrolase [Flavobacterium ginsenosidimutans]MBL0737786.1 haloacid dehalogenase-like hydrolase [Flavobacterium tagetis]
MKKVNNTAGLKLFLSVVLLIAAAGCKKEGIKEDSTAKEKAPTAVSSGDHLPSWNDTKVKQDIIAYVKDVTNTESPNFIPVKDRIATFDNDGTLWAEQPFYFQLFFALDQVKALAPKHPEWKSKQPFKAVLENNMGELMKQGKAGLMQIVAVSHAGMSTDEFEASVGKWISTAKHPTKKKLYRELIYQPMLELVKYLQDNQFKVFIVSGGGIDFMRAWAEDVYGIPKDQIVGSTLQAKYDYNNGKPVITKLPALDFNDDKEGKPVAIEKYIGKKPVFSAGNSDGDLQMLQWAASNKYKNFELYVHHTDSIREWAYDRKSPVGTLDKGLDEGKAKNWAFADMKKDWKVIFPGN